jgi:formyltetrahydrofolate deformylase
MTAPAPDSTDSLILLIACPDRRGLVAAVTTFLSRHRGNILDLEQHTDPADGAFFMRVEFERTGFDLSPPAFATAFAPVARRFAMEWSLHPRSRRARLALFVTRESHCLFDLLARHAAGEWAADIAMIVGNRPDLQPVAARFGIPFHLFVVTPETKAKQEKAELALLRRARVDTVVLARYMQIISPAFIARYPNRIINIHHSFLPSFMGARPYHAAHERGVKIIGASSHYVTAELDHGPIIEQDVIRVTHRESVADFIRKGKDVEKIVLARAVTAHLEHRVLVFRNRTIVFGG